MRTPAEIVAKMGSFAQWEDIFGVQRDHILGYLPFEDAKQFLVDGATAEDWAEAIDGQLPPLDEVRKYLEFAWGKANDCRGLSANRSIDHFRALFWLEGMDDVVAHLCDGSQYRYYGKPLLVFVSEVVGFDWRAQDDGCWTNHEGCPSIEAGQIEHEVDRQIAYAQPFKVATNG